MDYLTIRLVCFACGILFVLVIANPIRL